MKLQKSRFVLLCAVLIVSVATVFLIPCEAFAQQAAGTPSTQESSSTQAKDELRISAHAYHQDVVLKVADLKAMPRTTVSVHNEHFKADETYVGVRVADLLTKMGAPLGKDLRGAALSGYLVATGSDGYVAVITLAEADPTFHSGEVIVADTMNGQPLDLKSGPFKLVVTEDMRPARWVRNLVSIELKSAK
ncbi:MAG TPA: molybdopterin-dependent oxidoreductase [Candidatus Acidoferrum sp.]